MLNRTIRFLIENRLVAFVLLFLFTVWGIIHSPFNLGYNLLPRDPVAVDAIPDIGENQQIVYTEWEGQSPQDIEDQITYPLTTRLLGIPGVKSVRSSSMFGFSSVYVIFEDQAEFYWSRSRIIEKLNSLPANLLPQGVVPKLGPDATSLGQIFWYTLEGRDKDGKIAGGWDLHELRTIQDFYVRNALSATDGVAEVSSIGGYVQEYQIDVNPQLLRQYNISLSDVLSAIRESNQVVGAKTLEINKVEYFVRGLGYIRSLGDIENIAVANVNFTPILLKDVAFVSLGPSERRGILDKSGAEVVGGVVVSRFGANPMEVINGIKENIKKISPGLPVKTLKDGTISQVSIVPFYDRSELIGETLQTLGSTLGFEILITILVVLVMLLNLRVSILISSLMPIVVLMVFIAMKFFEVDANILALSGIAIAIGTMVDMGIILTENIVRHLEASDGRNPEKTIYKATKEVSGAVLTAGLTTIISFIPVFSLGGAEGKLFTPLAFTKTVALTASMFVALLIIPPLAVVLFRKYSWKPKVYPGIHYILIFSGLLLAFLGYYFALIITAFGILGVLRHTNRIREEHTKRWQLAISLTGIVLILGILWRPLGITANIFQNTAFVGILSFSLLAIFYYFKKFYTRNLTWALKNKKTFLSIPFLLLLLGIGIWSTTEKEFMPSLDEGSFMLMPTSMPHAGISEIKQTLKHLDMAVAALPEVRTVVGKAGRVESALDPAPLSMYENLVIYKPEYISGPGGKPIRFRTNEAGLFETRDGRYLAAATDLDSSDLIKDTSGEYYRNWRSHIRSKEDIWNEIVHHIQLPGLTSTPKLQPIETRLVMLQSGMRAPMGIKVKGQDLNEIEAFGLELEAILKEADGINPQAVFADRIIGKPYLEIEIDREKTARYGLSVNKVQQAIETAVGGKLLTQTVEGRERYGVRVRYPRELRASPEDLSSIYVALDQGSSVPIKDLVTVGYRKGPQNIKGEDSFLVGYVLFDKADGVSEVTAVEQARELIESRIQNNELYVPEGITYEFSGTFENHQRAQKKLSLLVPLILIVIFLILYLQFRSVSVSFFVFAGVAVAFAGGFLLIWFYGQPWFMDFSIGDINFRELFRIKTVNLSVAVWIGFIALFGIATDDGVVMATYLNQTFKKNKPADVASIRASVIEAGNRRIRPCLMTTATTLLALLPILTSSGRGSDVMIPMAIPCFGGMLMALITLFIVPVLYSWKLEVEL